MTRLVVQGVQDVEAHGLCGIAGGWPIKLLAGQPADCLPHALVLLAEGGNHLGQRRPTVGGDLAGQAVPAKHFIPAGGHAPLCPSPLVVSHSSKK